MKKCRFTELATFFMFLATSCTLQSNQELEPDNDEGDTNSANEIHLLSSDTVNLNEKSIFKLVLEDSDLKIKKAYFDCKAEDDSQIDKVNLELVGCQKELFIHEDTIVIQLTPTAGGNKEFQEITVLAIDRSDSLSIHKGNFEYFVKE